MKSKYTVSSWLFLFAFKSAVAYGADAEKLSATLDFPLEELKEPDCHLPWDEYVRLFDDAVRIAGDEFLWFHSLDVSSITQNNISWYYSHNAPTLQECANRGNKYFELYTNSLSYEAFVQGDEFVTRFRTTSPLVTLSDLQSEWTLVQWFGIRKAFAGPALELQRVRTTVTNPKRLRKYEDYFQTPVIGGSEFDDLVYDKSAAELPNASGRSDPNLDDIFHNLLEEAIKTQNATTHFEKQLMALFQSELQNGSPTLEKVASNLGMSVRTLQRRITDLGYTYSQALDHHRHQLAASYLKQPELNITDVALMVGYSNINSFGAAFHKYHGITPTQHRKKFLDRG